MTLSYTPSVTSSISSRTITNTSARRSPPENATSKPRQWIRAFPWENYIMIALTLLICSMLIVIIIYRSDYSVRQAHVSQMDPKTIALRDVNIPVYVSEVTAQIKEERKKNCQIIYVLGVEGATHHGFAPILEYLAKSQIDSAGIPYDVVMSSPALKFGLFGWYKSHGNRLGFSETPPMDDPELVRKVIADICPLDGRKHIIVEDNSFPCGQEDDIRSYRVHRDHNWLNMSPEEIANSETGKNQPTNLYTFYEAYNSYADIKFLVLHRPYLETIASHASWDKGPIIHSNIIRGFLIVLHRFLASHIIDPSTGKQLWLLICVEKHFAKFYNNDDTALVEGRRKMIYDVAQFLNWPITECTHCFDSWHESTKDYAATLGQKNLQILSDHMTSLEGIWPPNGKQCRL